MKKITQAEIDELRTKTPYADLDDLAEFVGEDGYDPTSSNEDLLTYVKGFAKPANRDRRLCLACGEFMGGFVWGLTHGHGHCRNCSWPATLYHFIKDRDGKDLATVHGVLLQVHPDNVKEKRDGRFFATMEI